MCAVLQFLCHLCLKTVSVDELCSRNLTFLLSGLIFLVISVGVSSSATRMATVQELEDCFHAWDKSQKGHLTFEEFKNFVCSLDRVPNSFELEALKRELGDKIDLNKAKQAYRNFPIQDTKLNTRDLKVVFTQLDTKKKGSLPEKTILDIMTTHGKFSKDEASKLLQPYNKGGAIDYNAFAEGLNKLN